MDQFSLEKYLENPSRKVVTRDGKPVRIVCWNLKCNTPIIAAIQWNQEREDCYCYNTIGRCANNVSELDLFFADEEELTEFEKALSDIIGFWQQGNYVSKDIKTDAKSLLDLARKELQPEFDKELDKAYKTRDDVVYRNGYAQGKKDVLKATLEALPKWKKMPNGIQGNGDFNPTYLVRTSNGHYFTTPCISWDKDSMYIELSEFEKLPKEE